MYDRFKKACMANGWLIFSYTFLLFLPEMRLLLDNPFRWLESSLPLCFFIACIVCAIGSMIRVSISHFWNDIGNVMMRIWHIFCHIIVYFISFSCFYIWTAFHLKLDYETFLIVMQTNHNEVAEFFQTYIFERSFCFVVTLYLIIGFGEWMLFKYRLIFRYSSLFVFCCFVSVVFFRGVWLSGKLSYFYFTRPISQVAESVIRDSSLSNNILLKIFNAYTVINENNHISQEVESHIGDTRVFNRSQYQGDVVLIIGESHIKSHSSLYGYAKDTNPYLRQMGDSLSVFQDVISCKNLTCVVFQEALSVSSVDDDKKWNEVPLFPAVFKDAGWNVIFCSNQITNNTAHQKEDLMIINASMGSFLNSPKTDEACFTTRNNSLFRYDEQMVDSFIVNRKHNIDLDKPSLYIINLMGQHYNYQERFSDGFTYFRLSDYIERDNLSPFQKQEVANYDNACRYNDIQLYKLFKSFDQEDAIVIYMSDHGDEVFDYRDCEGRRYDLKEYAPQSYHCQIDVPFLIYMTESYIKNHPEKASQVKKSVERPFMTDDICHLLFYLGDVDTQWYDSTKCLIHSKYYDKRKRILYTGENYDEYAN